MSRVWTDNQKNAINVNGGSVIVSAAAGSGKTAVLVERVISMITDRDNPVDIDRILVVTYTRLAAKELKDRLNNKLYELLRKEPDNKNLLRQQALLNKAMICTVDSFCSSLVKEYFYVLDIERNFRILEKGELDLIKNDALKLTLDNRFEQATDDFYNLVESFGGTKDDWQLQHTILKIHEFLRSHPFPQRWVDEKLLMFESFDNVSDSSWSRLILEYAAEAFEYLLSVAYKSIELSREDEVLYSAFEPVLLDDRKFIADSLEMVRNFSDWDSIYTTLYDHEHLSLDVPKGYTRNPIKKTIVANRKLIKDTVAKLMSYLSYSEEFCIQDINSLYRISKELFSCVLEFSDNFQQLKASKKAADYQDLEHWTIRLLCNEDDMSLTDIACDLQKRFDHILVDEYQDANEVQDTIFSALSKDESNLFFVGDVKQSIYGFRQAMPQLFLKRRDDSTLYDKDNTAFPAKIILDKNFRSKLGITKTVNYVFEKLMSKSVGDIVYDDSERLVCGAQYEESTEPDVTFSILDLKTLGEEDENVAEATYIAQKINCMIGQGYMVKDGDSYRPATYGDFAVLIRKANARAPIYVDTLISCGVPACCESSYSFLKSREIMVMTDLLTVIDNPLSDVQMLSVMMSPMFGFSADDLSLIKSESRYSPLYNCVRAFADKGDSKCIHLLDEIKYYRDLSVTMPIADLLSVIYDRSGYMSIVSATMQSDLSKGNLQLLKEYAKNYESSGNKGLSRFVSYLNRLKDNDGDLESAVDLSLSSSNCVRVMSVHGSKGLEFPVCIVANMAGGFVSDISNSVLIHSDLGIAVKHRDTKRNHTFKTMTKDALSLEIKRDEMSEELRILYVAMTRAKQKLIMLSTVKDASAYLKRISSKITASSDICPFIIRGAASPSDWITMCALLHPDGAKLREYCDTELLLSLFDCSFEADVVTHYLIDDEDSETVCDETHSIQATQVVADSTVVDTLTQRVATDYINAPVKKLVSKVAASELAHKDTNYGERILATPAFLSDNKLTPAQRGTALHAFMQFCDFRSARENLEAEIERLTDNGYISLIQAESIDRDLAKSFINSDLITRCLDSDTVYKEYRFTIEVNASLVDSEIAQSHKDTKVILQGAVDLAFVEDSELVIVDYKTDRVKSMSELYDRYHTQLELYRDAMQECTDYKVKSCLIYSVRLCDTIEVL